MRILDYIKIFQKYTNSFLFVDNCESLNENIRLKQKHSLRVFKNASDIAKSINADDKFLFIAQLCGLFHDIGRFEQFSKYKTFKDDESIYHGALGVEVMQKERFLKNETQETQNIVFDAIYNHGLIDIERKNKASLLFSKITRDADKIDIFKIVAKYYREPGPRNIALEYGLENSDYISDIVLDNFYQEKMIDKKDLKTLNDFKLMQIAWIFDLNFEYTKNIISEKSYLNAVVCSMNIPETKWIYDKINQSLAKGLAASG
ncbi:MAG: HD domain-containing protein [Bacteroidales bacterium]|nr:HD domain-containing protein [Bacteroidales bacterium]